MARVDVLELALLVRGELVPAAHQRPRHFELTLDPFEVSPELGAVADELERDLLAGYALCHWANLMRTKYG
jgi:hypothetical protein